MERGGGPGLASSEAMRRLARPILLALLLVPAALRALPSSRSPGGAWIGKGEPPRHWLGRAAAGGPSRDLTGDERLLLGLPLDPNRAGARELAFVPGLSAALAAETVLDRGERGPFRSVDDLLRVRGIGPRRLARASPFLRVTPVPGVVAEAVE